MREHSILLTALLSATMLAVSAAGGAVAATNDLAVFAASDAPFTVVAPGDSLRFNIFYSSTGETPASNVVVAAQFDASRYQVYDVVPEPNSQGGSTIEWSLGTLTGATGGILVVAGVVPANVAFGDTITFHVSISGDVADEDPENDASIAEVTVQPPSPDLWVWKWGLLEELEQGFFFAAEQDVPTTFNLFYFNWSNYEAESTVLTDALPPGVEFISAVPAPSSVDGQTLTWDLGTVDEYGNGTVTVRVRPTEVGSLSNVATVSTSSEERNVANNSSTFPFEVLGLLPPRILKPAITADATDSPAIIGGNTTFEGLARAGATVTLYEGSSDGCFGDFEGCNPVSIASATAGSDRRWTIAVSLDEARDYFLYLQAELDGSVSTPPFELYAPFVVRIDPVLDLAGFDLTHFTVETGNQTIQPNALGGSSGMTPNEPWVLNFRQQAPDVIATDELLQENHALRLEIFDESGQHTETLPVTVVVNAGPAPDGATSSFDTWDFRYEREGFGPGSRVEVWCLPTYYTEEGDPIVALVPVKCHEMLIDPAGYVYDLNIAGFEYDWPSVPPDEALITTATVTALLRTGDDEWTRWEAEESGQVNPQVTDDGEADRITVPGYYAFYVPPGQYQVNARAPGYAEYVSPILTVVDAPVFHNVGMQVAADLATSIEGPPGPGGRDAIPSAALLHQNYPNPFNPSTTISYALMAPSPVMLTVHNLLGQEVARLVQEVQQAGMHHVLFEARDLSSGVYFYRLQAGAAVTVRKMTLVR